MAECPSLSGADGALAAAKGVWRQAAPDTLAVYGIENRTGWVWYRAPALLMEQSAIEQERKGHDDIAG